MSRKQVWLAPAVAGGLAGISNGFFGGGGGMVLVPLLTARCGLAQRRAFATSVAIILPLCVLSSVIYLFRGGLDLAVALPYLAGGLLLILDPDSISQETRDALTEVLGEDAFQPETQEAIQAQMDQIGAMMDSWKARDAAKFDAVYGKDVILDSEDELNRKLFTGRDPGMIQYAADYLNQTGSHTGLLVVGAGHMVGDTGVVQGLRDLGYTVELVPVP